MRYDIRWEHQRGNGRRCPRLNDTGGRYSSLLLFCGALTCVFSAYRQVCDILPKISTLVLPERFWFLVVLAAAALSVLYSSGKLKWWWLRLLPVLPLGVVFYRYYIENRLPLEDGSLYIARCYVEKICIYYDFFVMFPPGIRERAPDALLFWCLLLMCVLFVLAAAIRAYGLLLLFPLAVLAAGLAAGIAPGQTSVFALLAAVLLLGVPWAALPDRWYVRTAQLAGMLGACIIAGALFAAPAEMVAGQHDQIMKKQLALEDAMLRMPLWDLFEQEGAVNNQTPRATGKDVLTIRLDDRPTENIYLKEYAASRYENGRWTAQESDFAAEATKRNMTPEAAGTQLLSMGYDRLADEELAKKMEGLPDIFSSFYVSNGVNSFSFDNPVMPQPLSYEIDCRSIGKKAPLPYMSALPDGLKAHGDASADKPWNRKHYSGSLMTGRDKATLFSFLQMYCVYDMLGVLSPYSAADEEEMADSLDWYGALAAQAYTKSAIPGAVMDFTAEQMSGLGFHWQQGELDEAFWASSSNAELNSKRMEYAFLVQYILQQFGTYSRSLDPLPAGADPVDYFLATSEKGYCTHYASAAVLMLQNMGIPARYASGYIVFPQDFKAEKDGCIANVTDHRGHAWAEIYLEDFGWMPLEVTPGYAGSTADEEAADPAKPGEDDASQNVTDTGDAESEDENEPDDIPEEENEHAGEPDGDRKMASDEKQPGAALLRWLGRLAVLLGAALVVWLAVTACRIRKKQQEERLRREIRDGQYKSAINRMNRRIYRRLRLGHPLGGIPMRDDEGYRRVLMWHKYAYKMDVDAYMRLVREAHFSDREMCAEDAETVYGVYRVIFDRG